MARRKTLGTAFPITLLNHTAEKIPLNDHSVDTVVVREFQSAVYTLLMLLPDYWQPIVRCKTPDCFDGTPTYLPHPNLPEITELKPDWPGEHWKAFLICKYCGRGYRYSTKDVEWVSTQNKGGLPANDLMLLAELRCAQQECDLSVKVYLGSDIRKKVRETNGKLKEGSGGAECEAGHFPAEPLDVIQINSVDEIE